MLLPSGAVLPQVIRPNPVGPWERWMDRAVAAAASGGATMRILWQRRSVSWLSRRVVGVSAEGLHLPAQEVAAQEQGDLDCAEPYEGVGLVGGGADAVVAQVEGEAGAEGASVPFAAGCVVVAGQAAAGQPLVGQVDLAAVDLVQGGEGVARQLRAAVGEEDGEVLHGQDGADAFGPRGRRVGAQGVGE